MRGLIVAILSIISLSGLTSAFSEIRWLEKDHDLGIVEEDSGKVYGSSRFVVTGEKPMYINQVIPGCGCTEVDYYQGRLNPGDTAEIKFAFDPKGRPGRIDKIIKVYLSDTDGIERINLSGTVSASNSTLESRYPYNSGSLRLENLNLIGGEFKPGMRRHLFVGVYNEGYDTLTPRWITSDNFLEVKTIPESLGPKESGSLSIFIDTSKTVEIGRRECEIEGELSDGTKVSLSVFLNIVE